MINVDTVGLLNILLKMLSTAFLFRYTFSINHTKEKISQEIKLFKIKLDSIVTSSIGFRNSFLKMNHQKPKTISNGYK